MDYGTLKLKQTTYPLFIVALLLIASCSTTRSIEEPVEEFPHSQSPDPDDEKLALIQNLCPFGKPVMRSSYQDEQLTLIVRDGYAIKHHDRRKTPIWVCEQLIYEDVHGELTGRKNWRSDPELCETASGQCDRGAVYSDYVGSGWDRGYLAPNLNQRMDVHQKRETFYFSNAAPQEGRKFNQSVWEEFERELTVHLCAVDRMWTITGLLYFDDNDPSAEVNLGVIGTGDVHVPTHFFKIVVYEQEGEIKAFAAVMPNTHYESSDSYRKYIQSIAWLESVLDIDFMPELDLIIAESIEGDIGVPLSLTRSDCNHVCVTNNRCIR